MIEPCKVEVAYTDGYWFADVAPHCGDAAVDRVSLMQLVKAVQLARPDEALLFVVDRSTIDGHAEAESEFLEASEKSGAVVVSSTEF